MDYFNMDWKLIFNLYQLGVKLVTKTAQNGIKSPLFRKRCVESKNVILMTSLKIGSFWGVIKVTFFALMHGFRDRCTSFNRKLLFYIVAIIRNNRSYIYLPLLTLINPIYYFLRTSETGRPIKKIYFYDPQKPSILGGVSVITFFDLIHRF